MECVGLQIGPLCLHFYGIILMTGVVAAAWMTYWQAKKRGEKGEYVWDMLPWVVIGGVVGARLWHVLTPTQSQGITAMYYFQHPLEALMIWKGGLGIPGAVMGGVLVVYLYARKHGEDFRLWMDFIAPGLALAQAIGRWGNFVNQELYGAPTNLPWAIFIDEQHRLPGYADQAFYHPLFLYESIWNLLNMGFLLWFGKRYQERLKYGDIFLLYMLIYGVGRFALEFLRLDASLVGGLNVNQMLMVCIVLFSAFVFFYRHKDDKPDEVAKA